MDDKAQKCTVQSEHVLRLVLYIDVELRVRFAPLRIVKVMTGSHKMNEMSSIMVEEKSLYKIFKSDGSNFNLIK
jgi:hypothetical protein